MATVQPFLYVVEGRGAYIVAVSYRWGNKGFLRLISQEVDRGSQAVPQASLLVVFRVKGYFSLLPVNGGVVLFKLVYKWYNIGLKLLLVSVYIQVELCYIGNFLCSITTISKLQGAGFSKGQSKQVISAYKLGIYKFISSSAVNYRMGFILFLSGSSFYR